jgi:hypothetical protein
MEVEIVIRGKVKIPDDDLAALQKQGPEELATVLVRHGTEVKGDIYFPKNKGAAQKAG